MKRILVFTRITLATILILAIGLLPHHHHHGQHCWALNATTEHPHGGEPSHQGDCPSDPCSESNCYLQSMRTFLQAERHAFDNTLNFIAILPKQISIVPTYIYISKDRITHAGYLLPTADAPTVCLRGPPTI